MEIYDRKYTVSIRYLGAIPLDYIGVHARCSQYLGVWDMGEVAIARR